MRAIFERIEHNNYLPANTTGHGFTGWLQVNVADAAAYAASAVRLPVFQAALKLIGWNPDAVLDYITGDANYASPTRDQTQGLWGLPFHVTSNWKRFSPRDYILETLNQTSANGTQKYPLHLQLNSLATKVLFDECSGNSTKAQAVGVEYLYGKSLFRADPRYTRSNSTGVKKQAFARKEVIVAGGTFSSPQILQLSGIGPKALLQKHNISVISDLPGVGRNLQDNYEIPVIGHGKISLLDEVDANAPVCTQGAPGDPCVDLWRKGEGPYARGGSNANAFLIKTSHAVENERDSLLFSTGSFPFRGFKPDTKQNMSISPNTFSWSTVKIHPQNGAGVIQIKSTDPQDPPDVNLNYFAEGAEVDIPSMLDTVAFARRAYASTAAPAGPLQPVEPPCPAADIMESGHCRNEEIDRKWIEDQTFGHHPTSTNSVGPDSNPLAVLDTRLRVKGVERLRVIDASAFPRCPGAFPAVATYMLSERATELVLEDADKL
jgi:choline dehydrogenase